MSWPTGEMPRIVAERGSLGGVGIITKYAKNLLFVSNCRIHTCIQRVLCREDVISMYLQISLSSCIEYKYSVYHYE